MPSTDMNDIDPAALQFAPTDDESRVPLAILLAPLARHWRSVVAVTLLGGVLGFGGSYAIKPMFTATARFIPPQQQSTTSATLASLGALAGLGGAAQKSPADEYVAFMGSVTVADRLIDQFGLLSVYDEKYRFLAREKLAKRTMASIGKKDGLITIAVQDTEPKRAAAIANQYIEELRRLTSTLAVSEAQRRRVFFEKQLQDTKVRLVAAQTALQGSGYTAGALKAEPRSAADGYARLRADLAATEVSLQTLRRSMADSSPDVQRLLARSQALRQQVDAQEQTASSADASADYVGKYREFKYQETLFDMMARQYELARVDEAREGAYIQVVDSAAPPEYKSSPKRALIAIAAAAAAFLAWSIFLVSRARWQATALDPSHPRPWGVFFSSFRGR
ncbi:MAG: Wzz/FepE/Etk N-terminal domain-containing protein [Betaproteobacteria bacterium]